MSWNKYRFTSREEFNRTLEIAKNDGVVTVDEFNSWLVQNYFKINQGA